MAVGAEAIERFAQDTGALPATVLRTARALREAEGDLWPLSGKGGGKAARHVEAKHIVNMLLAFAGPQPSDATNMVQLLRPLRCTPRRSKTPPVSIYDFGAIRTAAAKIVEPPAHILQATLGERLERLLTNLAQAKVMGRDDLVEQVKKRSFYVGLSPLSKTAWITWTEIEGEDQGAVFMDEYREAQTSMQDEQALPKAPLRRLLSFGFPVLDTASDLLADTLRRQQDRLAFSGPEGSGTPENKAPVPCQEPAPVTNQPSHTERPGSYTPDSSERDRSAQELRADHSHGTAGPTSKRKGSGHERRSAHPPPAAAA